LAIERELIDELRSKLRANAVFQQLTDRQKGRILEEGEWRLLPGNTARKSWTQIGRETGLAKLLSSDMYRNLCGYAHAGSSSVMQISQAVLGKEERILIGPTMDFVTIVTANFIHRYCHTLPRARAALHADSGGRKIVKNWIRIGQTLDTMP